MVTAEQRKLTAKPTMAALATCLAAIGAAGCDDELLEPEQPGIIVFGAVNPNLTNPSEPVPGAVAWMVTRPGLVSIELTGRWTIMPEDRVPGAMLMVTEIWASDLEPRDNLFELAYRPAEQDRPQVESFSLWVDAECTEAVGCVGSDLCVQYECVVP